jgi:hypothetical protein
MRFPAVPLILLAAACAKGETPPAAEQAATTPVSSAGADPCAILTAEEIQATVGWTVATSRPKSGPGYANCTWSSEKANTVLPPETLSAGYLPCLTNFPCSTIQWPGQFASSAALAEFRVNVYKGTPYADAGATASPVDGLGVPAIIHELGGEYSFEAFLGGEKTAFVSLWTSAEAARSLGEKVLGRLK